MLTLEVGCALSVVNATNRQREVFIDLQHAQFEEYELHLNNAELQYQQSVLSKTLRIVRIATADLNMRPVVLDCTQLVQDSPQASDTRATASGLQTSIFMAETVQ
ncbi:Cell division protein FtsL [Candidatus Vallotia tarda]|uniref:Cell division protein FtsL n=2 Tax=Candidatus Vallotiella hemipterorum TaxID=1177213 RepID=A0A916JS62_9BURK|nr:Cell division protein FtsL [Candidatus Vallotia tarda]